MSDALAPRPASQLAPQPSRAQVLEDLAQARRRLEARLQGVEQRLGTAKWTETVRKHPVLTLGGALALGYVVGWLWSRRS
jgi:ElaB/YqjD/DUF883 family membrane-anchored ribosome-binding protein